MDQKNVDKALVYQVLQGHKEAFDILVIKYQYKMQNVVRRYIRDRSAVKDIVQESFLNAYMSLKTFNGDSSFYTWLCRIAINLSKNYARKERQNTPYVDINYEDAEQFFAKDRLKEIASPESLLQCAEVQGAVFNALNMLPHDLRMSIILHDIGGLSYRKIATIMNCPVGTVRSRVSRAKTIVDKKIKPMSG